MEIETVSNNENTLTLVGFLAAIKDNPRYASDVNSKRDIASNFS